MRRRILVLAAVVAFLYPVCAHAAIIYEVIDLGTLGGDESEAWCINDAGQIVGVATLNWPVGHATLFDPIGDGNNIDLGTLGGSSSVATSINNAGQIVGWADYIHGIMWSGATLFDPTGARNNIDLGYFSANSINDSGQIVGCAYNSEYADRATLFDPNETVNNIDLGDGSANSINDSGQIVGSGYSSHATLFDPTGAGDNIDLGTLGGDRSEAYSINNSGQIVGRAEDSSRYWRATFFDPTGAGNNIDLGTLGGSSSRALSINDTGQIVGRAHNAAGLWRATLFDPTCAGNNINLNTLIDPNSGWTLEYANDINNSGWIVGRGINPQGEKHAFLLVSKSSKYSGGTGKPVDPYLIYTAEHLNAIGTEPNDWDKHFKLMVDIDLSEYDEAEFNIMGIDYELKFTGVFDGNGHTISNFTYDCNGASSVGLFAYIDDPNAEIKNLGLIKPNIDAGTGDYIGSLVGYLGQGTITNCYAEGGSISGSDNIGGLVGYSGGAMVRCYSTCSVYGASWFVGGLIGYNSGSVIQCYSNSAVSGTSDVGGLLGENHGRVIYCKSTGMVSGEHYVGGFIGSNLGNVSNSFSAASVSGEEFIGGFVGSNGQFGSIGPMSSGGGTSYEGELTNCFSTGVVNGTDHVGGLIGEYVLGDVITCFWDIQTSGMNNMCGSQDWGGVDCNDTYGKTTAEMQTASTFIEAGWDFLGEIENGLHEIWQMPEDGGYPVLSVLNNYSPVLPGQGTHESPYLISTPRDLASIIYQGWNACYRLTQDIDLSGITWSVPVITELGGEFDGNGCTISNLTIFGRDNLGLIGNIGYRQYRGKVWNLGVVDANITCTGYNIGILAGSNGGEVTQCYSTGTVNGNSSIGGLIGSNAGSITSSYSTGSINGSMHVGGLVGDNNASITGSYSTGIVSGGYSVGGLVGENGHIIEPPPLTKGGWYFIDGTMLNCYSQGFVSGKTCVGGLVGLNSIGSIIGCYATGTISGSENTGGLVGSGGYRRGVYGFYSMEDYVFDSFWDIETSGQTYSYGGKGKTTSEMQMSNTFLGWGACGPIWTINESQDYPHLAWENVPGEVILGPTYGGGTGSEEDPYLIYTAEELNMVGISLCNRYKHFKLMADIDMSDCMNYEFNIIGAGWDGSFAGIFDGNGHTISNLTIIGENYVGLFAQLDAEAEVRDLCLVDVNVIGSGYYVGGLAGSNEGTVIRCYSTGTIEGNYSVGGLVGENINTVINSYSNSLTSGSINVGGLVGGNSKGASIKACYSIAQVLGATNSENVGGLAGLNGSEIIDCYSNGIVKGDIAIGGLVGSNSYFEQYGLEHVNQEGIISNCYSTSYVTGNDSTGGLVGSNQKYWNGEYWGYSRGKINHSFWDIETSGQLTSSGGGIAITTDQMQTTTTFLEAGWDFVDETVNGTEDIWWINEGQDYPKLWWEEGN